MAGTGGARSAAARDRIAAAARRLFAAEGYERATVRAIAAEARVAPAMLIRYFGSKEGLFAATVDFQLETPDLSAVDPSAVGPALVRHFLNRWETAEHRGDLAALLRAGVDHQAARERLNVIFAGQLVQTLGAIVGPERAEQAAALVASQMLGIALCRYILQLPPAVAIPSEVLVETVGPTIQRYLDTGLVRPATAG